MGLMAVRSVGGFEGGNGGEIGGWVWRRWWRRDRWSSWLSLLALSLSSGVCLNSFSSGVFSENALKVKSKRKWFYASKWLFSSQSVFDFPLTVFSITAKHTQGCKMISWKCFQAKQTQPTSIFMNWKLFIKEQGNYKGENKIAFSLRTWHKNREGNCHIQNNPQIYFDKPLGQSMDSHICSPSYPMEGKVRRKICQL